MKQQEINYNKLYQSTIQLVTKSKKGQFQEFILKYGVLLSTFALQFISFFTTWAGVQFYFAGVHPLAPLFFAGVIQGMLYLLCNTVLTKEKGAKKRLALTGIICIISICFSYVGIVNSDILPEKDFKESYEKFYNKYTDVHSQVLLSFKDFQNSESILNTYYGRFDQALTAAQADIDYYESENTTLSGVNQYLSTYSSSYSANKGQYVYGRNQEENPEYAAARQAITDNKRKINMITGYTDNIRALLDDPALQSKTIIQSYQNLSRDDMQALNSTNGGFMNLTKNYNSLTDQLTTAEAFAALKINEDLYDIFDKSMAFQDLSALSLTSFDQVKDELESSDARSSKDSFTNSLSGLNSMLFGSSSSSYLLLLTDALENEINTKFQKFQTMNIPEDLKPQMEQLQNLQKTTLPFQDINLLAFSRLAPGNGNAPKAWFCFMLAALVDSLTVLIPFLVKKRRSSILFAKHKADFIVSESDLTSVIFQTMQSNINLDINKGKYSNMDEDSYVALCESHVRTVVLLLRKYLYQFRVSPWTKNLGYSLYIKKDTLDDQNIYTQLTSLLIQLDYIKMITSQEFKLLRNDYDSSQPGLSPNSNPVSEPSVAEVTVDMDEEEYIYLMSSNFENWFNTSFSENIMYSDNFTEPEVALWMN